MPLQEVRIPIRKVPIHRRLRVVQRLEIAVVDDRAGHAAEHPRDHVEELGA
jgi:hypothetical protein